MVQKDTLVKIVVVGGVAAGASVAARARRLDEDAEIIILERGHHVSFANCGLPYFVGGEITERDSLLLQTPESLRAGLDLDVTRRCIFGAALATWSPINSVFQHQHYFTKRGASITCL